MSSTIQSTNNKLRIGSTSQEKVKESTVLKQLAKLRKLDLQVNELILYKVDITSKVLDSFQKLLVRDGHLFNTIKLVSCIGHEQLNAHNTLAQLVQMICDFSTIQTLVVSGTTDVQTLLALEQGMRTNTTISTLRILGAQFVEDATAHGLQGFLSVNLALRELDLSKSHLSPIAVNALSTALRRNRQLVTLSLEECHLEDACLAQITSACLHVESLNVAHNAAHTETLEAITNLFTSGSCLKSLNLSHQHLGEAGATADTAARTARWQAMKGGLMQALDALPTANLVNLDISNNHLDDLQVMNALCTTLASPLCPLEHVDISDCDISHAGMHVVAQHLMTFETIKTLNVAHNDHNQATLDDLVQGLKHNRILRSLGPLEGVVGDDEHPEIAKKLQHYLDLNVAGRRALQQDIPLAVWPLLLAQGQQKVFEHSGDVDDDEEDDDEEQHVGRAQNVLFSMLRGPALFER